MTSAAAADGADGFAGAGGFGQVADGFGHAAHQLGRAAGGFADAAGGLRHVANAPVRVAGSAGPVAGLGAGAAFVLIAGVVVAIAVVAVIPLIMDVRRATAWRQRLTDHLIDRAATDEEVRDFLRDLREPRGVRGLTRSIIAVLILALVGFALAVAMLSAGADSGDLRKTIVTSLMTVLATVAGFYFGTLGAQNSAEDARRHALNPAAQRKRGGGESATGGTGAGGAAGRGIPGGAAPGDAAPGGAGAGQAAHGTEPDAAAGAGPAVPPPGEQGTGEGRAGGTDR